jgi:hypothetical protein
LWLKDGACPLLRILQSSGGLQNGFNFGENVGMFRAAAHLALAVAAN